MNILLKILLLFPLFLLFGCVGTLPEGVVPESLVGNQPVSDGTVSFKDAEAAMCGAVVRTLVRLGHSAERTPIAFTQDSPPQDPAFVTLLTGTDMILVCGEASAKYLMASKTENGIWELSLQKKDGTVLMKKSIRFR